MIAVLAFLRRIPWQVYVIVALLSITAVLRWHWIGVGEGRTQARWDAQEAVYARQRAEATIAARKVEERHRAEYRAIAERFLKDQADADKKHAATLADLRSGALQLRDRFSCPGVPGAAGVASGADAAGPRGFGVEDAGVALGIARDADETARRLNALIEAVKALRTRLGDLIADSTFATDVPTKQLKQVYAALTDDMSTAVQATKNPQAVQAVSRADAYYRAGMGRMEELERVIQRNGGPEKVFAAATSGSREGATTLRAVMQSLPDDGQKQLAAAVIRRMGRANPGAQNELGEEFSSERFLTMWNTLAPEAKSTLFGRFGASYVRDMEAIAKVAANRRAGAQVFRNPSQTTDAAIQAGTVFSFLTSLGTGNIIPAAGIAGGVTLANVVARGLTSPRVVGWLAKQTSVPVAALPMQLARLKAEATAEGDQEALEFVGAIENAAPARR